MNFVFPGVDPFKTDCISETVLMRLLKQDVIHHIKIRKDTDKDDPATIIYHQVFIFRNRAQLRISKINEKI